VVLDVDPEVAARRRADRSGAPELFEEEELQQKLAALYPAPNELVPGDRVVIVDGNADVDAVAAAVRDAVAPLLDGETPRGPVTG